MEIIPLENEPNQQLQVILDDQECSIAVYSRCDRLFMDLTVGQDVVFTGAICNDRANVVPFPTSLFQGSLHFFDMLGGNHEPSWDGLSDRYTLIFVSENEDIPESLAY